MNILMRVKRIGPAWNATLLFVVMAAVLVSGGLGCQKKSSQPTTTTQASTSQTSSAITQPASAATDAAEPATSAPAASEPASTAPAGDSTLGANATQADYLNEQASDQRAKAHEQSAVFALSDIKTLLAQKEYASARDAAKAAVKDYADTKYARDFVAVLADAETQATAAQEAQAQLQAQIDKQSEADRLARQARFERRRDDGVANLNAKNYPSAIYYFQAALKEQDDAEVQALLEQAIDKSTNPRIAVGDFAVSGNVGVADAGRSVAEIVLTKFDPTKFQLVERSRLSAIMDEKDLTLAGIVDNPKLLSDKKIKGVKYLVLGTVSKLGTLAISARLVDVTNGQIVQTAEVEAADMVALQGKLGELAALLAMSNDDKQAYLADRERLSQREAQQAAEELEAAQAADRDDRARQLYWRERQRQAALQRQQHERDAVVVVGDIKSLIARGMYKQAARYARQAVTDFSDTPSAMELTDLRAVAEREMVRQALAQKEADEETQRQAAALEVHMQFSRHRQDGLAAYRRSDYRQAIASFRDALRFEDSEDVRDMLRNAQTKLKVDEDRAYTDEMDRAARAMREGRWGDAMEAYQGAMALRKTDEAQKGVASAKKKLQQQAQYRQMLDTANDAVAKGDFKAAWKWIDAAKDLSPESPEAKALAMQLGPTLIVRVEIGGKDYSDAKVTLDGKPVKGQTPVGLRLAKGREQDIEVTVPPHGGKNYAPEKRTLKPTQDGLAELVVQVKEVKIPVKTPEQIAREKKYADAIQAANDAIADTDYRKAWLRINEAMTTDPAGQEAKDLAARLGPTLGVKATLGGKEIVGAQVSINGKVQGQATPVSFRFKKGQTYKVAVTIPEQAGKTYTSDEMTFKADENDYTEFAAKISEVKATPVVPVTPVIPATKPDITPPVKPRPPVKEPTVKEPTTLPVILPATKPVIIPTPKPPIDTDAEKAEKIKKTKYEVALEAAVDAINDKNYTAAWEKITTALTLYPDGEEAKTLIEKLGPTLMVTAELDGEVSKSATVTIAGVDTKYYTPANLRLKKGQTYEVTVCILNKAGKTSTTDTKTIKADKNGPYEFHAVLKKIVEPVTPATKPVIIPTPKPPVEIPATKPAVITPPKPTVDPAIEKAEKAKKKKYDTAIDSAVAAIKDENYTTAWEQIEAALALYPDGEEVKTLIEKLGPTLTVTAEVNAKAVKGATVTITGVANTEKTPAGMRLKKGQAYEVTVSIESKTKTYTTASKTIKADKNGPYEFHAVLKEVVEPVVVPPVIPTPKPDITPPAKPRLPVKEPTTLPVILPTSKPVVVVPPIAIKPAPEPTLPDTKNAKYLEAVRDAKDAVEKKDYQTAWQQINLALSIVPDGKDAKSLVEKLGPTLTVKAMLSDAEYPGARVTINGDSQKDTTPSAFKLKLGETYKVEVTIVKRGKSYTTDTRTFTPDKAGNTEFTAVIKEVK